MAGAANGLVRANENNRPRMNYRVGKGTELLGWIRDEFGFDIGRMGTHSKEDARKSSQQLVAMQRQLKIEQTIAKNWEAMMALKVEIENLRLKLIQEGKKNKEQIDKAVKDAIIESAKHKGFLKEILQMTQHGVGLAGAETAASMQVNQVNYQARLQMVRAKRNAGIRESQVKSNTDIQTLQQASGEKIQSIREEPSIRRKIRERETQFNRYINGEETSSSLGGWAS